MNTDEVQGEFDLADQLNGQTVTVLGATGSIGVSTLDVIGRYPDKFRVFALTANTNVKKLAEQCEKFKPVYAVTKDAVAAERLRQYLSRLNSATVVLSGGEALSQVAADDSVDTVVAAIVGGAGLIPTLSAVTAGKKVLLANKEALVMAGQLFMEAVKVSGATLLPVDSEHNAMFQCLPVGYQSGCSLQGVRKLLLTGSGGPFRTSTIEEMAAATPEQACKHPNWSMGKKISVDSATLMNKGLEFIEAKWLFNMSPDRIEVVVHPQSVIHSMVEYVDGSVLAQLGHPDMRTPIAHALAWPSRIYSGVSALDFFSVGDLSFEKPDVRRFPALALAIEAASSSSAAIVLNAANEVAVDAFLRKRIGFADISRLLTDIMQSANYREPDSIEAVLDVDSSVRHMACEWFESQSSCTL